MILKNLVNGRPAATGAAALILGLSAQPVLADSLVEALQAGTTSADIRLRTEAVEQDNPLDDATALTVRTRLTYTSGDIGGFSTVLEMEDSRIVAGVDDYSVPQTGFHTGEYSVIADPETTELDQAFLQYQTDAVTVRAGRQVFVLDGHRFVGHVGWRQDRQTFDALSVVAAPLDGLDISYAYLSQRNRIFAEEQDIQSKDHLLNAGYQTPVGKLTGYAYLLEQDNDTDNALDTYGVSFTGSTGEELTFLYALEYATQDSESGPFDFSADYSLIEGGIGFSGFTIKLGMETLGSDGGLYGFSTPLATLHKFNGWADQFLTTPTTGLVDTYLSAATNLGDLGLTLVYHDYEADEDSVIVSDLGDEIDFLAALPISDNWSVGAKLALYSAGDAKVDTDKFWVWAQLKF